MSISDNLNLEVAHLLQLARLTATGTTSAFDLGPFTGAMILNAQSIGRTTNTTLAVKLQHSNSGTGSWADVPNSAYSGSAGFPNFSNAAAFRRRVLKVDEIRRFVRVSYTITGLSADFNFTLIGIVPRIAVS